MSIENKLKIIAQIGGLTAFGFLAGSCAAEIKAQSVPPAPLHNLPPSAEKDKNLIAEKLGWSIHRLSDQTVRIATGAYYYDSLGEALNYLERDRGCQLSSVSNFNDSYRFIAVVTDKDCLPGQ